MDRLTQTLLIVHPGAELYAMDRLLLESATGMLEVGRRVVVALPRTGPLASALRERGAEVRILPMLILPGGRAHTGRACRNLLRGFLAGRALLRRLDPDLVLLSTASLPQWPVLATLHGVTSVSHLHELAENGAGWAMRLALLPHLHSRRILVSGQAGLRALRRLLPTLADRADVVPDGIDAPSRAPLPREPLEMPLELLFLGRLTPRSGVDLAVDAASQLSAAGLRCSLTILGDAPAGQEIYEQRLRRAAAEAEAEVELVGVDHDIWRRFAAADIVLVPSRLPREMPRPLLEAALAIRPVVTSDAGSHPAGTADLPTVRRTPTGDARALADATSELVEHWSEVVAELPASRSAVLRRHAAKAYRSAIVRACGAEDDSPAL